MFRICQMKFEDSNLYFGKSFPGTNEYVEAKTSRKVQPDVSIFNLQFTPGLCGSGLMNVTCQRENNHSVNDDNIDMSMVLNYSIDILFSNQVCERKHLRCHWPSKKKVTTCVLPTEYVFTYWDNSINRCIPMIFSIVMTSLIFMLRAVTRRIIPQTSSRPRGLKS